MLRVPIVGCNLIVGACQKEVGAWVVDGSSVDGLVVAGGGLAGGLVGVGLHLIALLSGREAGSYAHNKILWYSFFSHDVVHHILLGERLAQLFD